jgi:hypothetical protein
MMIEMGFPVPEKGLELLRSGMPSTDSMKAVVSKIVNSNFVEKIIVDGLACLMFRSATESRRIFHNPWPSIDKGHNST